MCIIGTVVIFVGIIGYIRWQDVQKEVGILRTGVRNLADRVLALELKGDKRE